MCMGVTSIQSCLIVSVLGSQQPVPELSSNIFDCCWDIFDPRLLKKKSDKTTDMWNNNMNQWFSAQFSTQRCLQLLKWHAQHRSVCSTLTEECVRWIIMYNGYGSVPPWMNTIAVAELLCGLWWARIGQVSPVMRDSGNKRRKQVNTNDEQKNLE